MNLAHFLSSSAPGVGIFGAIVGGSGAAAKNYSDYKNGLVSYKMAVYDVSKETTGAGVATAASAVAAGVVGSSLALTIVTAVGVAAGVKYAWDRGMDSVDTYLILQDDELAAEVDEYRKK
jgi:hypothetical protein